MIGAWANAWRERTEKFRDLTIAECVHFLQKHDIARRQLQAAQTALFPDRSEPIDTDAARGLLDSARDAWRELETQAFLISLILPGGAGAPATQDAKAVSVLYLRWRHALEDLARGRVSADATEQIVAAYSEYAVAPYNDFTEHANEAIRPRFAKSLRRRPRHDPVDLDRIDELEEYLDTVRETS